MLIGEDYMRSDTMIPSEIQDLLHKKYNVLGNVEFKQFDHCWENLRIFFHRTRKSIFEPQDRYVIEHQDTDIYIPEMSVGLNLRNFFQIVNELDIPLYTIIIWTNHFGLQHEIDLLCGQSHTVDRPTIIESFCARPTVADQYLDLAIDDGEITHHALCMMGANRSHRFALYHALKHVHANKLAISIKGIMS